jgi:phospholipid/cholesterol/gamma-HCH transport system permease protein
MATAAAPATATGWLTPLRTFLEDALVGLGDLTVFTLRVCVWLPRRPAPGSVLPVFYAIGFQSVPVVAVTGLFIGMVLAVQAYSTFHHMGMETYLGGIVNSSVVRELGPVLAATMLAGRVGSAMAAELATMRVTEQLDALTCLGRNPLHQLVVPRLLACVLLIPLLTILADFMGVMGGSLIGVRVFGIDRFHYWNNAQGYVTLWDLTAGLTKPMTFGAAIALVSCHRGFHGDPGAEGVGRAATRAFVASFIAILVLDFFLAMLLNTLHDYLFPHGGRAL